MSLPTFFFIAITLLSTCNARSNCKIDNPNRSNCEIDNPIRMPTVGRNPAKINCQSFRVGVEANNIQNWAAPPDYCLSYIKSYLTGKQYNLDVEGMVIQAVDFAKSTPPPKDLRPNTFVFDLDETLISNLGFFNFSKNGTNLPLNYTALHEWILSENSTAPALPAIKYLYDAVLALNFKVIIISESPQSLSAKRISHLKKAGYDKWDAIIFRGAADNALTNEEFKTKALRSLVLSEERYRIIATVGDQWTDLNIPHSGRTFKVPNPIYYVVRLWMILCKIKFRVVSYFVKLCCEIRCEMKCVVNKPNSN